MILFEHQCCTRYFVIVFNIPHKVPELLKIPRAFFLNFLGFFWDSTILTRTSLSFIDNITKYRKYLKYLKNKKVVLKKKKIKKENLVKNQKTFWRHYLLGFRDPGINTINKKERILYINTDY